MTTVAAKAGLFAADTQLTGGGIVNRVCKLYRLPDGGVAGAAGTWSKAYPVLRWLAQGEHGDPPEFEGVILLIGRPDGSLWLAEDAWPAYPLLDGFAAIGSGAQGAMAEMQRGGTAVSAVVGVLGVDRNTSEPVQSLRVRRPK